MVTDVAARVRQGIAAYGVRGSIPRVIGRRGMLHRALLPGPDDRAHLRRGALAGLLMGLALCAKSWPIWLIPGMLLLLPNLRARVMGLFTTGLVPVFFLVTLPIFAGTSLNQIPAVIDTIRDIRPIVGEWGWTPWFTGGSWDLRPELASFGTNLIYVSVIAVILWWRRADPIDMTTAILIVFMIMTPRLGAQYLLWFMPFLVARPTRFAWAAILTTSFWSAYGYLVMTQFGPQGWWLQHTYWSRASILILPILALALPWNRRVAEVPGLASSGSPKSSRITSPA
jgi:hypothetical protein